MRILLACLGFSDPYGDDKQMPGPMLTMLEEQEFDVVCLLWAVSDEMNNIAQTTTAKIQSSYSNTEVRRLHFIAEDPTNLSELFHGMKECCDSVMKDYSSKSPSYTVQISSGTPQMQAIWMLMVTSGYLPATMMAVRPRYYRNIEPPYCIEVKFDWAERMTELIGSNPVSRIREQEEQIEKLRKEVSFLSDKSSTYSSNIDIDSLPEGFQLNEYLRELKKQYYHLAYRKYPDNASKAARLIGVDPHTYRMESERMGLRRRGMSGKLTRSHEDL